MRIELKRLSPSAACAAIALLGGLAGGTTAVHGLRPNSYGPSDLPMPRAQRTSPAERPSGYAEAGYGETSPAACDNCSERDFGYRWAALQDVHSPEQCPNDSWGFRRGCLDYTGGV